MVLPVWKLGTIVLPVVSFVLFAWWLNSLTLTIIVTERQLFVGEAHIDRKFVPAADRLRRRGGPSGSRSRSRRPRLPQDPPVGEIRRPHRPRRCRSDPTPYWLVSSRHPHKLAAALNA
jgi:hypothetical protein